MVSISRFGVPGVSSVLSGAGLAAGQDPPQHGVDGGQPCRVSAVPRSALLDRGHSLPPCGQHGHLILSPGLSSLVSALPHHQGEPTGDSFWNHAGDIFHL